MATLSNSRAAARVGIEQARTLAHADRIADGIDGQVARIWSRILRQLVIKPMPVDTRAKIAGWLREIYALTLTGLADGMREIAHASHARTIDTLITDVPKAALVVALAADAGPPSPLQESRKLTEPQRRQVEAQLFPALSAERVTNIVMQPTNGMTWNARIARISGLAPPEQLAALVVQGMSQGQTVDRMARMMLPSVQGVRTSARRIARTEGMRVAHEARMTAYDGLGDLVIGYQIHATMDWRVRPHHAARNGTVYLKNPKPGQPSTAHMPRPPLEEDGTVAHNCRCYLTPVLEVDPEIESDPAAKALFTDNDHKLVPDPVAYDDWFATASDQERRWAVGARRLATVTAQLKPDESLTWSHFLSPDGQLLPLQKLQGETQKRRQARMGKVNDAIAQRRELVVQVSRFGYLGSPPEPEPTTPTPDIKPAPNAAVISKPPEPVKPPEPMKPVEPMKAAKAAKLPKAIKRRDPANHGPVILPQGLIGPTGWRLVRYLAGDVGDGHLFELVSPTGRTVSATLREAMRLLGLPPQRLTALRQLATRARLLGLSRTESSRLASALEIANIKETRKEAKAAAQKVERLAKSLSSTANSLERKLDTLAPEALHVDDPAAVEGTASEDRYAEILLHAENQIASGEGDPTLAGMLKELDIGQIKQLALQLGVEHTPDDLPQARKYVYEQVVAERSVTDEFAMHARRLGLDADSALAYCEEQFSQARIRYRLIQKLRSEANRYYGLLKTRSATIQSYDDDPLKRFDSPKPSKQGAKLSKSKAGLPPPNWSGWEDGDITQLPNWDMLLQAMAYDGSEYVDAGLFSGQGTLGNEDREKAGAVGSSNAEKLWDYIHPRNPPITPDKRDIYHAAFRDMQDLPDFQARSENLSEPQGEYYYDEEAGEFMYRQTPHPMDVALDRQQPPDPFDDPFGEIISNEDYAERDWSTEEDDFRESTRQRLRVHGRRRYRGVPEWVHAARARLLARG